MKLSKKVTSQSIIGQLGANLIEQIVLKMGYVWRATSIFDVGIDGEIEIRDPMTGEMTNTIVKVQAKATTKPFQAETDNSFEYHCSPKDLDYWLQVMYPLSLLYAALIAMRLIGFPSEITLAISRPKRPVKFTLTSNVIVSMSLALLRLKSSPCPKIPVFTLHLFKK